MSKYRYFGFIVVLVAIAMACFNTGVIRAAFNPPKDIAKYIPSGFTIDEAHSATQNLGMYTSTGVVARKANNVPKPFTSPRTAEFILSYLACADHSIVAKMGQDAQKHAEEHSVNQNSQLHMFIGKEAIKGGGTIYWYKGTDIWAQGPGGKGYTLDIYGAEFIKQMDGGVVTATITDFVGEQDTIRKGFE